MLIKKKQKTKTKLKKTPTLEKSQRLTQNCLLNPPIYKDFKPSSTFNALSQLWYNKWLADLLERTKNIIGVKTDSNGAILM